MSRFGGNSAKGTNQDRVARNVAVGGSTAGAGLSAAGGWRIHTGNRQRAWADQATAGLKAQQRAQDVERGMRSRYMAEHTFRINDLRAALRRPEMDPALPGNKKRIAGVHRVIGQNERALKYGREYGKVANERARVTNRGLKAAGEAAAAGVKRARGGKVMVAGGAGLSLAAIAGRNRVARDWARPEKSSMDRGPVRAARPEQKPPARPLKQVKASVPELSAEQEARVKAALVESGWDASPTERRNQLARHMQGQGR